jgi:magnesium chelatase family protein
MGSRAGEASSLVRSRVEEARARQRSRLTGTPWTSNAQVPGTVARRTRIGDGASSMLAGAVESLALSGRGFDRALRVALTIADLAGSDRVEREHMAEALGFRALSATEEVGAVG